MKTLIPRTLRWQIVLALFGLVVTTIVISWAFTSLFTVRDFEHFVTSSAIEQAREYAHLLEARFNLQGEFGDLSDFLVQDIGYEPVFVDVGGLLVPEIDRGVDYLDHRDWDAVSAAALGIDLREYREQMEDFTPEELAEEYSISPDRLIAAIMQWESDRRVSESGTDDIDLVYVLSALLDEVELYVEGWYAEFWEDAYEVWEEELESPLLLDAPIVVVDVNGNILFDGSGDSLELAAPDEMDDFEEGFPIRDWRNGKPVGYVLSSRDPWEFSFEEAAFLGQSRSGLLIGGLIGAACALVFGVWLARRISRPVSALKDSATRLASGEQAGRLPVSGGELGMMSSAFNAMADSLAQQNEVRSRMISDLSHELNTPLAVLQLEMEALRDGMQSSDEAVEHMLRELDLLRNLAADVGMLAENEAGLLSIQRESIDLRVFMPAAADRWRTQAEAVGIDLIVRAPVEALFVEADATRLSQALGNLIRNALQHTDRGGTIEITCGRRPVDKLGGIWNTLCVHDSGCGIAPEDLERVFERSVRAQTERTGRGLGLTIARQIIDAHDGHIWAESTVDVGSSFCIALP